MLALSLLQVSEQSLCSYRQVSSQLECPMRDTDAHENEYKREMIRTVVKTLLNRIAVATIFIPVI
jgi:hypothetical protein